MLFALLACVPELTSPPGTNDFVEWVAPTNSWPMSDPPDDLIGEGVDLGEVARDIRGKDQYDAEVSLWQFYGSTIVLDISTMWCGPCQALAAEAQLLADDYRDQGVEYITLLPENLASETPTLEELNEWSEDFELYEPLIADDQGFAYEAVPNGGFPVILIIDPNMIVVDRLEAEEDFDGAIRAALDEQL